MLFVYSCVLIGFSIVIISAMNYIIYSLHNHTDKTKQSTCIDTHKKIYGASVALAATCEKMTVFQYGNFVNLQNNKCHFKNTCILLSMGLNSRCIRHTYIQSVILSLAMLINNKNYKGYAQNAP